VPVDAHLLAGRDDDGRVLHLDDCRPDDDIAGPERVEGETSVSRRSPSSGQDADLVLVRAADESAASTG
jgi:hypothetical protein